MDWHGGALQNGATTGLRSTSQTETLDWLRWRTERRLETAVSRFIEVFRVRHRQHATLGCLNQEAYAGPQHRPADRPGAIAPRTTGWFRGPSPVACTTHTTAAYLL